LQKKFKVFAGQRKRGGGWFPFKKRVQERTKKEEGGGGKNRIEWGGFNLLERSLRGDNKREFGGLRSKNKNTSRGES